MAPTGVLAGVGCAVRRGVVPVSLSGSSLPVPCSSRCFPVLTSTSPAALREHSETLVLQSAIIQYAGAHCQ